MKKMVMNVMVITVVAKLLGFARELLLSYYFGASGISDAYLISQTIPGIIFQFVGTGLATCFIPVYLSISNQEGEKKANCFTNTVLTLVFIFSTVVVLIVWLKTELIVNIFASGFEGQTLKNAVFFTKVGIVSLYFSTLIYVMNSYLQLKDRFGFVAFTAIPNSLVIMGSIIVGAKYGINWLPIGSIVAVFVQAICLLYMAGKEGFIIRLNVQFRNSRVLELARLMVPVTIGVSINELNVLIDRTVASKLAVGGISALTYAESLVMFVQGIFVQTIATVYYPELTRMAEGGDLFGTKKVLNNAMRGMMFLLLPITIGCIVLSGDIVRILYERGNFRLDAVIMTTAAFMLYAVGILGYGCREVLSRVFYAFQDTKTPMVNAGIGVAINIVMNLTLSPIIGIGGLALATSLSATITAILLFIQLHKKYGFSIEKRVLIEYVKLIVAAIVMGAVVFVIRFLLARFNVYMSFVVTVFSGIFVYMVCTIVLKVDIIKEIKQEWRDRRENV